MRLSELTYISNILSLTRVVLVIPIYYLLNLQTAMGSYLAVAVMFLAALTDAYDGRLARKLKQRTDLGRVLDPLADKITIAGIAIILAETRGLPVWFVVLIILRDVGIVVLSSFLVLRTRVMVESNMLGKITVTILGLTVVAYTVELSFSEIFLYASIALLAASSVSYSIRMKRTSRVKVVNEVV